MRKAPARKALTRNTLVFDLDGTLVDSLPDLEAALNAMLSEMGVAPLPQGEIRAMIGDGAAVLVARALAARGFPETALADRLPRFLKLYEAAPASRSRAYPGVTETLARLHAGGFRLGICTNKPQSATLAVLRGLGLDGFFEAVIGGDALAVKKPDPGHLRAVITALGAEPGNSVMIGDNEHDVATARAAGVPVVLVTYGYARLPLAELVADARIDVFADLPRALAALDGAVALA